MAFKKTDFSLLLEKFPIQDGESSTIYAARVLNDARRLGYEYTNNYSLSKGLIKRGYFTHRVKSSESVVKGEVVAERFRFEVDNREDTSGMAVSKITQDTLTGRQWVRYAPASHNRDEVLAALQDRFKDFRPPVFKPAKVSRQRSIALLNLYDAHLDKISVRSTTGEASDLERNIALFKASFETLLTGAVAQGVERIVFPIGHDLFHTNDYSGRTKKGTPIEYLCQPNEAYERICETMVWAVGLALSAAPVYVPFTKGNHDEDKVHTLGFWMGQVFKRSRHFECDQTRAQRKYLRYGVNLLGFAHGDKEKSMIDKLPLLMAEERKQDWAATKYRKFYCGDLHHQFEYKFMRSKDFTGCNVEFLRSVGGPDTWHADWGWIGIPKTASASIWSHDRGNVSDIKLNIV